MTQNVQLQNLRDFTVQIRRLDTNKIVGTGFIVLSDGQIITCRHVVRDASGIDPRFDNNIEVGVYYPQIRDEHTRLRRATVSQCFFEHDDDVVLLKLIEGSSPLPLEQYAILGQADDSIIHPFLSYGYRFSESPTAGYARGDIIGSVESSEADKLLVDIVQLESGQIRGGMSGSPVLDRKKNLVVGIISDTYIPDEREHPFADRDTAWCVNARVLEIPPFLITIQKEDLEKRPAPQPQTDINIQPSKLVPALHNPPVPLGDEWTGRVDLLKTVTNDFIDSNIKITGLIGFGGEGKSSLARQWLDTLLMKSNLDGIFWWAFYDKANVDEFF